MQQLQCPSDILECYPASVATQKIENPRLDNKKTKKTQGQISIRFRTISRKNRTFREKTKLFLKKCLLTTFFFSNFYHFSSKMSDFLQKTTAINVFSGKFKKKPRKTQGPFENPRKNPRPSEKTQEPKIVSKNPRSWEKTQAMATLVDRLLNDRMRLMYI